jgi:hypothetical protein
MMKKKSCSKAMAKHEAKEKKLINKEKKVITKLDKMHKFKKGK